MCYIEGALRNAERGDYMKNCGNCVYKYLLITQEPCMECLYCSNWEADEEQEEEDNDN